MNWSSVLHTLLYLLAQHPDLVDEVADLYRKLVARSDPPAVHDAAMIAGLATARASQATKPA